MDRRSPTKPQMRYVHLHPAARLPDLSGLAPFLAIVVIEDSVEPARRHEICGWLVATGCRYVLACGSGCESWPAEVRDANLRAFDLDRMSASDFVMTTSHPGERLRSVFWFAKQSASHPEVELGGPVVLHLGSKSRAAEYQALFLQS